MSSVPPELADLYNPQNIALIMFVGAGVFLIPGIIFLIVYLANAKKIKEENKKDIEQNMKISATKNQKRKVFFIIFGPILAILGFVLAYYGFYMALVPMLIEQGMEFESEIPANPELGIPLLIAGAVVVLLGIILLIIGIATKVRKHQHSRQIERRTEGNKVYVTYPKGDRFEPHDFLDILQDNINDGYTDFIEYSITSRTLVLETHFDRNTLQQQYERREKYFLSQSKRGIKMPEWFSDNPVNYFNTETEEGEKYTKTVDHYKTVRVKTGTKITTYSDGHKTYDDIYENKEVYDYTSLDTYQHMENHYHFFNPDGSELVDVYHHPVVVTVTWEELLSSKRL